MLTRLANMSPAKRIIILSISGFLMGFFIIFFIFPLLSGLNLPEIIFYPLSFIIGFPYYISWLVIYENLWFLFCDENMRHTLGCSFSPIVTIALIIYSIILNLIYWLIARRKNQL